MQDTVTGLGGLFVSAFISATVAPGGSEMVLAYLVNQGNYQVMLLLLVATLGNTLGAMTTWGLGYWTAIKRPIKTQLPEKKQQTLHLVKQYGVWILLLSWLPVVGDGFCFAGGWLKLPLVPVFFAILIGKLSRYAVIAGLFN